MRVACLESYLSEIVAYVGGAESLVAVTHDAEVPEGAVVTKVTREEGAADEPNGPSSKIIDYAALRETDPELIVIAVPNAAIDSIAQRLSEILGHPVRILNAPIETMSSMYEAFETIGKALGASEKGRSLSHRIKAQLMDWAANFYERTRNKKVTVLSSISPLRVAGLWVPELIKTATGIPQHYVPGDAHRLTGWDEIERFRPDVLVVAPEGYSLRESAKTFQLLGKQPEWDELPAVKRGEVIFMDGESLYRPGPRILDAAAILISGMAGLESGYITTRDSFYRLRWLELHRHRI